MIFVNSMSDLFHKAVPKAHIARVFDTMEFANWHVYQILTKRSSLMQKFINDRYKARPAPPHI
jgi:protein gp37